MSKIRNRIRIKLILTPPRKWRGCLFDKAILLEYNHFSYQNRNRRSYDQAVKEEIVQLLENFYAVEKQIKEKESLRTLIRNRLEEIAEEHGDMSIENIGVIKIIPESTTITIDGKEVQRVIDLLLKKDLFEYASMLSKAKKETVRQKSLRISKWKEKK